jgi:hypothetical protein
MAIKLKVLSALLLSLGAARGQVDTQGATTTAVNQTGSTAYSTAKTSVPLLNLMGTTGYAATCSLVGTTGDPSIVDIVKFLDHIDVTVTNGGHVVTFNNGYQGVSSGASEIDCIVTGVSK